MRCRGCIHVKGRITDFLEGEHLAARRGLRALEFGHFGSGFEWSNSVSASANGHSGTDASFPLTPALSLGEREDLCPCDGMVGRSGFTRRRSSILPLPAGEGRGEGEGDARVARALRKIPRSACTPKPTRNMGHVRQYDTWAKKLLKWPIPMARRGFRALQALSVSTNFGDWLRLRRLPFCRIFAGFLWSAWAVCLAIGQHTGHDAPEPIEKPVIFLDKNPRIIAYQLNRLTLAQLLQVERNTAEPKFIPVYEAILIRTGMGEQPRLEAAEALAQLRKTDAAAELIAAMQRADEASVRSIAEPLGRLLAAQLPAALKKHQTELETMAADSPEPAQREAAFAALTSFQPPEFVWRYAQEKGATAWLLTGLRLQPAVERRTAFFGRIEPLLQPDSDAALRRSAITAAVAIPTKSAVVFNALARLYVKQVDQAALVLALQQIPKEAWAPDQLPALVEAIVAGAQKVPANERTEPEYLDLLQLGQEVAARLPPPDRTRWRKTLAGLGVNMIRLRTLREQMFFDRTLLVVEANQPVAILFENTDAMQHNLVIAAPGTLAEVGAAAEKMPPTPDASGRLFVPEMPQVLYATRLLNPGDKTKLEFQAPAKPDRYPFACTYPGHWQRMQGVLLVVNSLAVYLEHAPADLPAPKMTEWKIADFTNQFRHFPYLGNAEKGKAVFTTAGCVACHQIRQLGAAYGPNLTEVFNKYQQDPAKVLGEILEPSRNIEPRYRSYNFTLADGDILTGFIVQEDATSLTLQTGPSASTMQKYARKDLPNREPQPLSIMPSGLLNLLDQEQILDLLAFLSAPASAEASPSQ